MKYTNKSKYLLCYICYTIIALSVSCKKTKSDLNQKPDNELNPIVNISFDHYCVTKNSAIIAQSLIEFIGADSVNRLLDNKFRMMLTCEVDHQGHVIKLIRTRINGEIPDNFENDLEIFLIKNPIYFYICYSLDMGERKDIAYYRIVNSRTDYHITFGFPGDLMSIYDYEREKLEKQGVFLSRYDYLRQQIKKYLKE